MIVIAEVLAMNLIGSADARLERGAAVWTRGAGEISPLMCAVLFGELSEARVAGRESSAIKSVTLVGGLSWLGTFRAVLINPIDALYTCPWVLVSLAIQPGVQSRRRKILRKDGTDAASHHASTCTATT